MLAIKFEKPTIESVTYIAEHMRLEDSREVWASNRKTPLQAMLMGWKMSNYSMIVTINDVPCVMIGLVIHDILTGTGVPWLLGTQDAVKHKRQFLKLSPPVIKEMLTICPTLYNFVHAENKHSIEWLRWLGFTICDALPYGPCGELFHKFYIESDHVQPCDHPHSIDLIQQRVTGTY